MDKVEVTREIVFHGRVQGVNFRRETYNMARSLGLKGLVSNQPDGTVKLIVSGPEELIEKLILFCSTGILMARVEWYDSKIVEHREFHDFSIV